MKYFVLYNPISGNGFGLNRVNELKTVLTDGELSFFDVREVGDLASFLKSISSQERQGHRLSGFSRHLLYHKKLRNCLLKLGKNLRYETFHIDKTASGSVKGS